MKNKNIKMAIIAGIGFVASFFASTGVYAVDPQITINDGSEDLYVASGTKASTDGTASYNSTANTITLNNFHGDDIRISGLENITINLEGENTLTMNTTDINLIPQGINALTANLNITGTGSLKVERETLDGFSSSGTIIRANNITIDSATLDLAAPAQSCLISDSSWTANSARGDIIINSGTLKLNCDVAMQANNITINGGTVNVKGVLSSIITMSKNFTINDGNLTIHAESMGLGSPVTLSGSAEIKGGKTYIYGGQYGIGFTNLSGTKGDIGHFSISGGELNINADTGISVGDANANSYMEFSGGTTVINAKYNVAEIIYRNENDRNIMISNEMKLYPEGLSVDMEFTDYSGVWQEYMYYLKSNGSTTIITDNEDNIPNDTEGKETPVPNTSAGNDTTGGNTTESKAKVKTPETGAYTKDNNFILFVLPVLPIFILLIGIAIYTKHNKKHHIDFN